MRKFVGDEVIIARRKMNFTSEKDLDDTDSAITITMLMMMMMMVIMAAQKCVCMRAFFLLRINSFYSRLFQTMIQVNYLLIHSVFN